MNSANHETPDYATVFIPLYFLILRYIESPNNVVLDIVNRSLSLNAGRQDSQIQDNS
jgi:hypothetical protein